MSSSIYGCQPSRRDADISSTPEVASSATRMHGAESILIPCGKPSFLSSFFFSFPLF